MGGTINPTSREKSGIANWFTSGIDPVTDLLFEKDPVGGRRTWKRINDAWVDAWQSLEENQGQDLDNSGSIGEGDDTDDEDGTTDDENEYGVRPLANVPQFGKLLLREDFLEDDDGNSQTNPDTPLKISRTTGLNRLMFGG